MKPIDKLNFKKIEEIIGDVDDANLQRLAEIIYLCTQVLSRQLGEIDDNTSGILSNT